MKENFICAGISFYYPTEEDKENVGFYSNFFEKIYVYDNTPGESSRFDNLKVEVISSGSNDGLGVACAGLCETAKAGGFDYMMLLDQDSRISVESLESLCTFIDKHTNLAVVYCPYVAFNGEKEISCEKEYEFVDWCITSGSVIDLNFYGTKYEFDEKYFIDRLDRDLCEQIARSGGKICRVNTAVLHQQLGETGENGYPTHKPFRHYYIARNRLYYNEKFGVSKLVSLSQTIKHIFSIVTEEPEKVIKVKMVFKGISDCKKGKMGRLA